MATMFARVYRTFDDFERQELRKLDELYETVDNLVDEMLAEELEEDYPAREDGILFDDPAAPGFGDR